MTPTIPNIHDDNAWTKIGIGCWGFGSRYHFGYSDSRALSELHPGRFSDVLSAIACVVPDAWVIYIHGEHRAQVESWDEAKSIAAVLLNSKEME